MPGTPTTLHPVFSGLPLSGSDYNDNLFLVEQAMMGVAPYIVSGMVLAAGVGLSVVVSGGEMVLGTMQLPSTFSIGSLTNNTLNYLYVNQAGVGTASISPITPAGALKIGTATTLAGVVTATNILQSSGRDQYVAPKSMVLGGPGAGNPPSQNLASWNATTGDGFSFYGTLPAGALPPETDTLAGLTDVSLSGTAQGDLLYRGAATWNNLAAGAMGQVLVTNGIAANPAWSSTVGGLTMTGALAMGANNITTTGIIQTGFLQVAGPSGIAGSGGHGVSFQESVPSPPADADYTLSNAEANSFIIVPVTGAWASGHNLIFPATTGGMWLVNNLTGFSALCKTAAGTGITIANGETAFIWGNGTNIFRATSDAPSSLAGLTDVSLTSVAQGDTLYRGASTWNNLAHGTSGQFLQTQGAGANPVWATETDTFAALTDVVLSGSAQGDVYYRSAGGNVVNLGPGTNGQPLLTGGAAANPAWGALNLAGGASIVTGVLPAANVDMSGDVILAPAASARNLIVPSGDAVRPLAVQRHSVTQSANLTEWLDETGAFLAGMSPAGQLGLGAAPAGNRVMTALKILTDTSGIVSVFRLDAQANPASASSAQFQGAIFKNTILAACAQNITGEVEGLNCSSVHSGTATASTITGLFGQGTKASTGPITTCNGARFQVTNSAAGAIATGNTLHASSPTMTGPITTMHGLLVDNHGNASATTSYGVRIQAQSGSGTTYALSVEGGASQILTGAAATKALVLQGFSGQSANIFEVQDSAAGALWDITAAGNTEYRRLDSTTEGVLVGGITGAFINNTHASYTGRMIFNAADFNATREGIRIDTDGTNARVGIAGTTPTAFLHLPAGAAAASSAPLKLTSGPLLTVPEAGVFGFLTPTPYFTPVTTRRAFVLASDSITADVTVANTVTETLLFTGTIAANEMSAGKVFRVSLWGRYSALITDSFVLKFKQGGVLFLSITSALAALTNAFWKAEFVLTCRTAGGAGTVESDGYLVSNNLLQSAADTGTHAVDSTIAENLTVTITWSAASASDTLTTAQGALEVLGG